MKAKGQSILLIVFLLVVLVAAVSPDADHPNNAENRTTPIPALPLDPDTVDLNNFLKASDYNLEIDCSKTYYKFADGKRKSIVTVSGDNMVIYCQLGEGYFQICEDGVYINTPGHHDRCK